MPSLTITRHQAIALAAVALAAVFAAAHFLGAKGSASVTAGTTAEIPTLTTPSTPTPGGAPPAAAAGSSVVVVDVAGAVRRPGLYRLSQGSRIADAIARAGGVSRHADPALVNLAAPLADGEQVLVPSRVPGVSGAGAPAGGPSPTAPVDLNTATAEQLDALPGVGPVTAQKIIDYRTQNGPFRSVDDLDAIPGIGPARIDNLRGLVIA
jgi:competence protein ComEA